MIASQKYQDDNNHVKDFTTECLVAGGEIEHKSIYFLYDSWCDSAGERKSKLSKKELKEHMERMGYVLDNDNHKPQTWKGIQLARDLQLLTPVRK